MYVLATSPKTHYKIISLKNYYYYYFLFSNAKIFCWCWWHFLCLHNDGNSPPIFFLLHHNIYFNIYIFWTRFIAISNTELKKNKIKFFWNFFCSKLEEPFFLSICNFNVLDFFSVFHIYPWIFTFFPNKNCQVRKIWIQKKYVG